MKKSQGEFLRIPFTYRGLSSGLHLDAQSVKSLQLLVGDQLASWVQGQVDAIMAETCGISWLELHQRLTRQIAQLSKPPGQRDAVAGPVPRFLSKPAAFGYCLGS
jgi:hypothetical protein